MLLVSFISIAIHHFYLLPSSWISNEVVDAAPIPSPSIQTVTVHAKIPYLRKERRLSEDRATAEEGRTPIPFPLLAVNWV